MVDTKWLLARAAAVQTDSDAIAVLSDLAIARDAIKTDAADKAAPLQAQYEELARKLDDIWTQHSQTQAEFDDAIKRLGAVIAGAQGARKYSMPRKKPVSEAQILRFLHGTNVLYRPNEIAQGVGVGSTPAFRKMLRAMAEEGALDHFGERGGSKYCAKGADIAF